MTIAEVIAAPVEDGLFDIDEQVYHADRGSLSVSGAKLLLPPSCPAKFKYRMENQPAPKREYDFGHLAHGLVLGKGAEMVVLDPEVHGLKKDGTVADSPRATATWKAAEAEARERGATPVHISEYRAAEAMAAMVLQDPDAGPLFQRGHAERSMYATDPDTGVRLRGRADWLTMDDERFTCVDYKTSITANPAELIRKFWTYGYFMQAAFYLDLIVALGFSDDPVFRFVVQEKEAPYLVTVVEYDDEALAEGRRLNRQAIDLYAYCKDTDTWPGYGGGIHTIGLPRFALRDGINADAEALIAELEGIAS